MLAGRADWLILHVIPAKAETGGWASPCFGLRVFNETHAPLITNHPVEFHSMGKYMRTLKTLREIALEYSNVQQPDLASMARELGRVVHQDSQALAKRLAPLRNRQHGFERWLLAERSKPAISVLVMAWPPNHLTPVHDHAGLWGLEVTLLGALEVQSYARDPVSGTLRMKGRDWLGPGDGTWFEGDESHAHRCRNLSNHDMALTLHVYGGDLTQFSAYEQVEPTGQWTSRLQRSTIAGRLQT
jgi:predicted metal-dependent enzyme (double-stranded beta helix superfamily)